MYLIELVASVLQIEHVVATLAEDDEEVDRVLVALVSKGMPNEFIVGEIPIYHFK